MVTSRLSKIPNYDIEDDLLEGFLREIGTGVITSKTGVWRSEGARIYNPVRVSGPIEISELDIKELWDKGSFFLRYPVHTDSIGTPSLVHLLDDKNYDLDKLTSGYRRRDIRRSLKLCIVEQISVKEILKIGLDLIPDTMSRQGRQWEPKITQEWKRFFESASQSPLFEAWAAFEGNRLGAYLVYMTYRGGCFGQVNFNRSDSLRFHVMDALFYVSSRDIIRRPEIDFISTGVQWGFTDVPSVDNFKESMGFRRIEIREKIEVCPKLKPFFKNNYVCGLVEQLARKYFDKSYHARMMCWLMESLREQRSQEHRRRQCTNNWR